MPQMYPRVFWVDTETTGLSPQNCFAFQISYIISEGPETLLRRTLEMSPDVPDAFRFEAAAERVHGFSREAILSLPPEPAQFAALAADLDRFLPDSKLTAAGYAVRFDCGFLKALFARHRKRPARGFYDYFSHMPCDVLALAQNFRMAGRLNLPNLRLETVCAHFGIPTRVPHHSMADIENTRRIFGLLTNPAGCDGP